MGKARKPTLLETGSRVGRDWYQWNRRVAVSAWIYHLGLVSFSMQEHWHRGRRIRRIFGFLLVRDVAVGLARLLAVGRGALVPITVVTDGMAARSLATVLPAEEFLHDRALSQFGLGSGWALAIDSAGMPMRYALALPVGAQILFAGLWRVGWRKGLWYVIHEGAWSAAALLALRELRQQLNRAVDEEMRVTSGVHKRFVQLARQRATKPIWLREVHARLDALTEVKQAAARLSRMPGDGPDLVAQLAQSQSDRLRRLNRLAEAPAGPLSADGSGAQSERWS